MTKPIMLQFVLKRWIAAMPRSVVKKKDGTCVVDACPDAVTVKTNPVAVSSACDVQKCVCEGCSLNAEEPKPFKPQEAAVLFK